MSFIRLLCCRKCSFILFSLLLLQHAYAQYNTQPVDQWLRDNARSLGGRAVLVIYKDGELVYNHGANNLGLMQKAMAKRIARKRDIEADELLQDFDSNTKIKIASCSKWLSAALVMTFVDEGKLQLEDSIGKFLPVMTANGKGHIKIWQCLSHLTGIQTGSLKESIHEITEAESMDDVMTILAAKPMEGIAGKTFRYSNAGLQIAAAVIEKNQ